MEVVALAAVVLEMMAPVAAVIAVGKGGGGEREAAYGGGDHQAVQHCNLLGSDVAPISRGRGLAVNR
jgi:hypothetical protein